jgi:hypothetical protein
VISNAKEIYVIVVAGANTTIKQEEELAVCVGVVAERE